MNAEQVTIISDAAMQRLIEADLYTTNPYYIGGHGYVNIAKPTAGSGAKYEFDPMKRHWIQVGYHVPKPAPTIRESTPAYTVGGGAHVQHDHTLRTITVAGDGLDDLDDHTAAHVAQLHLDYEPNPGQWVFVDTERVGYNKIVVTFEKL